VHSQLGHEATTTLQHGRISGGDRLRAALKNARAARGLGAAQTVEIIVDPSDIRILRR